MANNFEKETDRLARLISTEMGKPITQAIGEVESVVKHARNYVKGIDTYLSHVPLRTENKKKAFLKYMPMGILYSIVPFNYPFYLTFHVALGNLLLGNCILTKPSLLTPMLAEATQEIIEKSGYNNGEFQYVYPENEDLDYILANKNIIGVHFTGSSRTGSIVAACAGKNLKKSVLELGGNDPLIVLDDANVDEAVKRTVISRINNAGQVCFSPKRLIVVGHKYEPFKNKLIERLKSVKFGDPLKADTEIGPLAGEDYHKNLQNQLKDIPKEWSLLYKTEVAAPFFPIHVYEGSPQQPYLEELFGPIFTLYKAID